MSKIGLRLKINLSEIDMTQVFQGKKGQYLDCTIFVNQSELDQYGNSGMITQDVKENAQNPKGAILGNGQIFWVENGQLPQPANQNQGNQNQGFQQQAPQQQGGFQQQAPAPQQAPAQGGFSNQTPAQQNQPYNAPQQPQGGFMPNNG